MPDHSVIFPVLAFLFAAGFCSGAMNSLAGGGSFVSVPAMIATGMPAVLANTSSTVALWPGTIASTLIYPNSFRSICGVGKWPMLIVTLVGGLIGSLLLLHTPSSSFTLMLPWLLLLATLALAFGRRIAIAVEGRFHGSPLVLVAQFILGAYGGYFGGAASVMMLAVWCLFGETDIKALQGPRSLLITAANTVAIIIFLSARAVALAADACDACRLAHRRYRRRADRARDPVAFGAYRDAWHHDRDHVRLFHQDLLAALRRAVLDRRARSAEKPGFAIFGRI